MAGEDVVWGSRHVESGADRDGDFSIASLRREACWSDADDLAASKTFDRALLWESLHFHLVLRISKAVHSKVLYN